MSRKPGELGDEAMRRIAVRTQQLMEQRGGPGILEWMGKNAPQVVLLAQCTWLATREELERDEGGDQCTSL